MEEKKCKNVHNIGVYIIACNSDVFFLESNSDDISCIRWDLKAEFEHKIYIYIYFISFQLLLSAKFISASFLSNNKETFAREHQVHLVR
jgi:hypothetical protein